MMNNYKINKFKRSLIFLLKIIVVVLFFSFIQQNDDSEFIFWDNPIQLKWDYFKGNPIEESEFDAVSEIGFLRNYFDEGYQIKILIKTVFFIKFSWVKEPTNNLLRHEQGHFNLSEIYARKLRKTFLDNPDSISLKYYKNQYMIMQEEFDSITLSYDNETDYSCNLVDQQRWNDSIAVWLDRYKDYADTVIYFNK